MTNPSNSASSGAISQNESINTLSPEIHPQWAKILEPHNTAIAGLLNRFYATEAREATTLPPRHQVLRAFEHPFDQVKVVIVGQDPYPTPGDAVGLSFSVAPGAKIPRSLANIYRELQSDLGHQPAPHGDLSSWSEQGVLLLNRVLTVPAGNAGGHRSQGWEEITLTALTALANRPKPLVAILWGKDAEKLEPLLREHHVIKSAHPSPLSARRGFFDSKPFSRANEYLIQAGSTPIDWKIQDFPTLSAQQSRGTDQGDRLF